MSVTVTSVEAINAKAHGPGEISGPGVEIVAKFVNASSHRVDFGKTVVNVTVTGSNGDPAGTISGAPADPFSGVLAPHSSAVGRYVFTLPKAERSPIKIIFTDSATTLAVVVRGSVK